MQEEAFDRDRNNQQTYIENSNLETNCVFSNNSDSLVHDNLKLLIKKIIREEASDKTKAFRAETEENFRALEEILNQHNLKIKRDTQHRLTLM